jgi:integrase/recombinase XerD
MTDEGNSSTDLDAPAAADRSEAAALVPWTGTQPAAAGLSRGDAVQLLPGDQTQDPFTRLAAAFLLGYRAHSARGYLTDLRAWAAWCARLGVHPFDARRHHVDAYVRHLDTTPLPRTGRPMAPASIARRLSAISQLYDYGISVDVLTFSPVGNVRRPRVSDESATTALTRDELLRLLDAADHDSPRSAALVHLLAYNGFRIDEILSANIGDYRHQSGHRVLRVTRKGGKTSTEPLAPPVTRALDNYLEQRAVTGDSHPGLVGDVAATAPLFTNPAGGRLVYITAYKTVRRLARKAGLTSADHITPHSLRHTFVTEALAAGAPLQDVQDAAGHADPRTTRRYDRTRKHHDNHPTYKLLTHLRRDTST